MMRLRQLTPDDNLDDLIAISWDFFDEYSVHHKAFFQIDELTPQHIRDYFSRSVATDNGATFIATAQGRIVGYITVFVRTQEDFWKVKGVGSISGLMVSGDYRRRGIATGLLAKAVAYLRRRGIKYFTTYTAVANQAAVEFFERSGMMPLHTTFIGEI
jgi:ribosomal protein S18 acetylase RimI-like enzyme